MAKDNQRSAGKLVRIETVTTTRGMSSTLSISRGISPEMFDVSERVYLKENFVQIHKDQLKKLIDLAEHAAFNSWPESQLMSFLAKLTKHTKKFNPNAFPKGADLPEEGMLVPRMSTEHKHYNNDLKRKIATRKLHKRVGEEVRFMWQGVPRTGKILGRDMKRKSHIAIMMDQATGWSELCHGKSVNKQQVISAHYSIIDVDRCELR